MIPTRIAASSETVRWVIFMYSLVCVFISLISEYQLCSLSETGVKFYCSNCGREGHRKHYCPELKDSLVDRRFKCRLCGKKGHNRRTCPKSRMSNHKGKVTWHHRCRICRQGGHNRRSCPQVVGIKFGGSDTFKGFMVSGSRKYTCRLCREKGHNARTCPSRNTRPAMLSPPRE
jgi:hypothetical protein